MDSKPRPHRRAPYYVLYADESPAAREQMRTALSSPPGVYQLVEVVSHGELEDRLGRDRFDLILLDEQAFGLDPRSLSAFVRRYAPQTPILVLHSQLADSAHEVESNLPRIEHISKTPQGPALLHAHIRNALGRANLEDELKKQSEVLGALTQSVTQLLERNDSKAAARGLLRCAIHQTGSQYGFLGVVLEGPTLHVLAEESVDGWKRNDERRLDREDEPLFMRADGAGLTDELVRFLKPAVDEGRVILANDLQLATGDGTIAGRTSLLNCMLGVPIQGNAGTVGFIGIADRPGGYTDAEQIQIDAIVRQAGVLCDHHRRRLREAELEELHRAADKVHDLNAHRYQALFEGAPDGIFIVDAEEPDIGRIISANRAAAELYGYEPSELSLLRMTDLVAPRHRERVLENIRNARVGQPVTREAEKMRKDGSRVVVEINAGSLEFSGQRYVVAFHRDVTARKKTEAALRESEARLRRFFHSDVLGLLCWHGETHEVLDANDLFCHMLGCSREQLLTGLVKCRDSTPEEYRLRDDRADEELKTLGRCQPYEKEFIRSDGTRTAVLISAARLHEGSQEVLALVFDITDLWRARQDLNLQQEDRAHEARLGTLGEMAASFAHELNQPLCAILGNAAACRNMLAAPVLDSAAMETILDGIIAQAYRSGEIIRSIRTFVHKREPLRVMADLNQVIRTAAQLLQPECLRNDVVLELDLGVLTEQACVDPVQIEQVLVNLVRNSLHAMEKIPREERQLVVSSRQVPEGFIEVTVRDSGCGLPAHLTEKAFKPFFSSKPGNLGLGLALCRSIIESHEGLIWFMPNPDRGVTIHFAIPVESQETA